MGHTNRWKEKEEEEEERRVDRRRSWKIDGENGDEHVPRYTTSLIIPNVDIIYLTVSLPLKLLGLAEKEVKRSRWKNC